MPTRASTAHAAAQVRHAGKSHSGRRAGRADSNARVGPARPHSGRWRVARWRAWLPQLQVDGAHDDRVQQGMHGRTGLQARVLWLQRDRRVTVPRQERHHARTHHERGGPAHRSPCTSTSSARRTSTRRTRGLRNFCSRTYDFVRHLKRDKVAAILFSLAGTKGSLSTVGTLSTVPAVRRPTSTPSRTPPTPWRAAG